MRGRQYLAIDFNLFVLQGHERSRHWLNRQDGRAVLRHDYRRSRDRRLAAREPAPQIEIPAGGP
jgi:hypothetical protein